MTQKLEWRVVPRLTVLHDLFESLPHCVDGPFVIIEYVPFGDLLGYLRRSRGVSDCYYDDPDIKPTTSLTSEQMLKFAWQISDGMRYISSKKVLAAFRFALILPFSNVKEVTQGRLLMMEIASLYQLWRPGYLTSVPFVHRSQVGVVNGLK